jgi:hypothetical protein
VKRSVRVDVEAWTERAEIDILGERRSHFFRPDAGGHGVLVADIESRTAGQPLPGDPLLLALFGERPLGEDAAVLGLPMLPEVVELVFELAPLVPIVFLADSAFEILFPVAFLDERGCRQMCSCRPRRCRSLRRPARIRCDPS